MNFTFKLRILTCLLSMIFTVPVTRAQLSEIIKRENQSYTSIPIFKPKPPKGHLYTEISYQSGIASFSMNSLKRMLEQEVFKHYPLYRNSRLFPIGITHTIQIGRKDQNCAYGFVLEFMNTGSKTELATDSVGKPSEMKLYGYNLGGYYQKTVNTTILNDCMIEYGYRIDLGLTRTHIDVDDQLGIIGGTLGNKYASRGFFAEPTVFIRIPCNDWINIDVRGGYNFNANGNIGHKDNTAFIVTFNQTAQHVNWSGWRLKAGLVASF